MSEVAANYARCFEATWLREAVWEPIRFVVLDTETTGLDPRSDRLISIGCVSVLQNEVRLDDSFEVLMPIAYNKAAVTLHGITKDAAQGGVAEPEALATFLDYLRDAVMVAHHLNHDWRMLDHAAEAHHGVRLQNWQVDTALLSNALQEAGAFGDKPLSGNSLDQLCAYFGLVPHDRHTATGDAFLTAQIFQRLLHKAHKLGWNRLADLMVNGENEC